MGVGFSKSHSASRGWLSVDLLFTSALLLCWFDAGRLELMQEEANHEQRLRLVKRLSRIRIAARRTKAAQTNRQFKE